MKNDAVGSLYSKYYKSSPITSGDLKLKSTEFEKRLEVGWFTHNSPSYNFSSHSATGLAGILWVLRNWKFGGEEE